MAGDLPDYYFRVRDNGALVFRVEKEDRQRRTEFEQIATINLRSGEAKPHGDRVLTAADRAGIAAWIARRTQVLAEREIDDIRRTVDRLNLAAQWVQTRATPAQVASVSDDLLLAMHDLRAVLVRKLADGLEPH